LIDGDQRARRRRIQVSDDQIPMNRRNIAPRAQPCANAAANADNLGTSKPWAVVLSASGCHWTRNGRWRPSSAPAIAIRSADRVLVTRRYGRTLNPSVFGRSATPGEDAPTGLERGLAGALDLP
jgi:hypothetical protein